MHNGDTPSLNNLQNEGGGNVMGSYENPKVDTRQKTSCTKSGETHTQKLVVQTSVFKFPFPLQLEIFNYTITY